MKKNFSIVCQQYHSTSHKQYSMINLLFPCQKNKHQPKPRYVKDGAHKRKKNERHMSILQWFLPTLATRMRERITNQIKLLATIKAKQQCYSMYHRSLKVYNFSITHVHSSTTSVQDIVLRVGTWELVISEHDKFMYPKAGPSFYTACQ